MKLSVVTGAGKEFQAAARELAAPDLNVPLLPLAEFIAWQDRILASRPEIYRVRRWGDPIMVAEDESSVNLIGTSNFQATSLYNKANNTAGGVSNFLRIPRTDMYRVRDMQVEDQYLDKQPDWRKQKMSWLCKKMGTIYFSFHGFSSGDWTTLPYMEWGTIQLGGNLVHVEAIEELNVKMADGIKKIRRMARLRGFRRTDFGRPLTDLLADGLVQRGFSAYFPNDRFGDSPKGIVYSPFWSPQDWTFIGPGQAQPSAFYIPLNWLVKQ